MRDLIADQTDNDAQSIQDNIIYVAGPKVCDKLDEFHQAGGEKSRQDDSSPPGLPLHQHRQDEPEGDKGRNVSGQVKNDQPDADLAPITQIASDLMKGNQVLPIDAGVTAAKALREEEKIDHDGDVDEKETP